MKIRSIAIAFISWLLAINSHAQGFLVVDQASGALDEVVTIGTRLPDNQIAQSFTPSLSAVGFVQFSHVVPAFPGNLRQGAYNGPILSSTDPVVLMNHGTEIGTFYFPGNISVALGQLYFFEPVLLSAGSLGIGYKFPSSYPGGEAWSNGGIAGGDYWFREGIVVPEPSVSWMLGFGACLFFLLRRVRSPS